MTLGINDVRSFGDLRKEIGVTAVDRFAVRSRGRPEMDPDEAKEKMARREVFGQQLKKLREQKDLTLKSAAEAAGIASARKLSQYETKCYPPGWVLTSLAPVYGVTPKYMAALRLSCSDPYTFLALTDGQTFEEFCNEAEV